GEQTVSQRTAVWITGVGAVTPLGHDYQAIADSLLAGRSGVRRVSRFDASQHPSQIAGQGDDIPCPPEWDGAGFAQLHPLEQTALRCCSAALRDGGWWDRRQAVRLGLVLGLGAEWLSIWDSDHQRGGRRLLKPEANAEPVVQGVRRRLGLHGLAISV